MLYVLTLTACNHNNNSNNDYIADNEHALVDESNEEVLARFFSMYTMTLVVRLDAQEVRNQVEAAKKAEIAIEKEMKKKAKEEKKTAKREP